MQAIEKFLAAWDTRDAPVSSPLVSQNSKIYNNLHVVLSKSGRDNKTVRINYIESKRRRKGEMKKFLKWIAAQADKGGFNLSMAVQPINRHYEESVPKEKLKETAVGVGFTERFEYPDGLGYEMVRVAFGN